MSQISSLYDETTGAVLEEEVKDLMATLDQEGLIVLPEQENCHLQFEDLPLVPYQSYISQAMPQADQITTSGTNNILTRVNKEEFPGEYNFEVLIDPHHAGSKSPWVYSQPLKKVFIKIDETFPVDFKVSAKYEEMFPELYVRVTPCYSNSQDSLTLVARCLQHMQDNQNHDVPREIWHHILRCNNGYASYHGGEHDHLSVLVPLSRPLNGLDTVRHMYQFVCKNSCTSGMNRRPLDVVFTLEDMHCKVLGRILMSARICSCPKRDKEKEEKEYFNRGIGAPPTKKRKAEKRPLSSTQTSTTSDLTEYDIPVKIPGKHNLQRVYRYIHDLMAGEMVRLGTEGPFRKTINEINKLTKNAD